MKWLSEKIGPSANVFGNIQKLWTETNNLVIEIIGSLKKIESDVSELKSDVAEIKAILREKS